MKHAAFAGRLVLLGFGGIGQGVLPLENPQRGVVKPEDVDLSDPWQFKNFRVR